MKHLKIFENVTAYNNATVDTPNICLLEDTMTTKVNKYIAPLEASIGSRTLPYNNYTTISIESPKTYVYLYVSYNGEKGLYSVTRGNSEVFIYWDCSIEVGNGVSTPSVGIFASQGTCPFTVTVEGIATSDTSYNTWESIPYSEKKSF